MKPRIIEDPVEMQRDALAWRAERKRISFVPTMGYLHEGHAALLRDARSRGDVLVLSIFVNPTQFAPHEDLDRYPRDLPRDLAIAEREGTDVVWTPSAKQMYPAGYASYVDVGGVSAPLEGEKRPGHFKGVATVVTKLFLCVQPHVAVFGQKDWQQLAVIRRMTADLNLPVEIVGHPIVRESDGLALSSRNTYLSKEERVRALSLSRGLGKAEALFQKGERAASALVGAAMKELEGAGDVEYVALVDPDTLQAVDPAPSRALMAMAVKVGKTRLIDNRLFGG